MTEQTDDARKAEFLSQIRMPLKTNGATGNKGNPINKVRVWKPSSAPVIVRRRGKIGEFLQMYDAANNYRIDIYEFQKGKNVIWKDAVIPFLERVTLPEDFETLARERAGIPVSAKLVMRLRAGECVFYLGQDKETPGIYRVQKVFVGRNRLTTTFFRRKSG
ncbi:MAG: hypothetical protein M5R36_28210 [Deltaproteobacteria bacterium]|nr:hypothetical protein [Deltaproteobacteria bacterium]